MKEQIEVRVEGLSNCICGNKLEKITVGHGAICGIHCELCSTWFECESPCLDTRVIVKKWNEFTSYGGPFSGRGFTIYNLEALRSESQNRAH